MGDLRASMKIKVEFQGIKEETDLYINWAKEIPSQVEDFLSEIYYRGLEKYNKSIEAYYKAQEEKEEKQEYERLKKKWDKKETKDEF